MLGLHTQDIFRVPGTDRMRAAFLACSPEHAHDIALFEVGDDVQFVIEISPVMRR